MNSKMKGCFTSHTIMHSLIGLGLGFFLAGLVNSLASIWLGLLLIVIGVVWDMMKK